ncbi:MAG: ATP-binding protein [Eubacteriales bacterium]|nr:ATP-binding protein [Eubacteriales bacterium]
MKKQMDKERFYGAVLLYSLIITAFAQFRLDILVQYFMVSLGIVLIPLFYMMIDDFPLMPVAIVSGVLVSVSRLLTDLAGGGGVGVFATAYLPEAFFYIAYAFLLAMYCDGTKRRLSKPQDIIALTFIDYVANMLELVLRQGVQSYTFENQMGIVFVGFVRSLLVFAVIWMLRSYRVMLMKHEDVKMYHKLLFTTTELSGETIWMRENMDLVETTMNEAYRLYDGLKKNGSEEAAQQALGVATKVHEIKKQYHAIVNSLDTVLEKDMAEKEMYISELAGILLNRLKKTADEKGVGLSFRISCPDGLATGKYYYMMSLLNNLFTNALEAARGDHEHIELNVALNDGKYIFTVSNDGKPIPKEEQDSIWNPGFSTKIDYGSGVVGRGLGLLVAREIVEKEFDGIIGVHSGAEKTSFVFEIPVGKLEVKE